MGGGRFSDGFLLGLVVGGGLALLFTTKKGNKILKVISEEGLEGLNRFIEEAGETVDEYVENSEKESEVEGFSLSDQETPHTNGEPVKEKTSVKPHRRFFRRKGI